MQLSSKMHVQLTHVSYHFTGSHLFTEECRDDACGFGKSSELHGWLDFENQRVVLVCVDLKANKSEL